MVVGPFSLVHQAQRTPLAPARASSPAASKGLNFRPPSGRTACSLDGLVVGGGVVVWWFPKRERSNNCNNHQGSHIVPNPGG